jgi:hypothetical protein
MNQTSTDKKVKFTQKDMMVKLIRERIGAPKQTASDGKQPLKISKERS